MGAGKAWKQPAAPRQKKAGVGSSTSLQSLQAVNRGQGAVSKKPRRIIRSSKVVVETKIRQRPNILL